MSRFERKNSARPLIAQNSSYLGTIAFKDTPDSNNRRYLWLEYISKELRWSIGPVPQNPCKRLCFSHIQSISSMLSNSHFGFKVQSKSHSLVFWLQSEKEAKNWINEINSLISSDENSKKTRAVSLVGESGIDIRTLNVKFAEVLGVHMQNFQSRAFEELPAAIKEYLSSIFSSSPKEEISSEVKSLKNQVVFLQNKIKSMEQAKIEYDKSSLLEEEYKEVRELGLDLSMTLDKLQADKANLSRDAKILKNEHSADNAQNKEMQMQIKKCKNAEGRIVTVNRQSKLAIIIPELHVLHLYHPTDLSAHIEKVMFSTVATMNFSGMSKICIKPTCGSSIEINGEIDFLKEILEAYERYQFLESHPSENALMHYFSVCDESERQLRTMERQVKYYKKVVTVRNI